MIDPDRARRLGEEGRKNVLEKFSVERMARDVAEVFLKVKDEG